MRIRWQLSAVSDLTNIRDYVAEVDQAASRTVVERVLRSVERLEMFPTSGRPGSAPGTREIVLTGLPYIRRLHIRRNPGRYHRYISWRAEPLESILAELGSEGRRLWDAERA